MIVQAAAVPSAISLTQYISRYNKVHKLLGKGSYGKVYKVQRASDDKFYALKETDLGALNQMERMDAVNEVRLLVSISHPTIVSA